MPNVFRFRRLSDAPEPNRNSEAVYADASGVLKQVAPDGSETELGAGGSGGSQPLTGSGPPDDGDGTNGQLYIDTDTHDLYLKADGSWT